MLVESPACFTEADRLRELSARIYESVSDPDAREAYDAAISDMVRIINLLYSLPEAGRELSDIFRWPFQLTPGFIDLLQIPTQESLAVMAHFAVIPEFLSSTWWLDGFGRRLLAKIYPLIDGEHLSWIQWPMQQLGITSEGSVPASSSYGTPMDIGSQRDRYTQFAPNTQVISPGGFKSLEQQQEDAQSSQGKAARVSQCSNWSNTYRWTDVAI
ncbi:hypothetical protein DL98DRAFT_596151 [Cadophora sp. DSE1049]|nr:hypothetical protein DL98DRAFT_596151 [Cadophora sp. DSE1049]